VSCEQAPFNEYALERGTVLSGEDGRWGTKHGQFNSGIDFGDLPAAYGLTRFANDGARHCIGAPQLGNEIDPDSDGQESAGSSGDDSQGGPDDEDGISVSGNWVGGTGAVEIVVSGGRGCLNGWIDFNGNNDFGVGEQVLVNESVDSGTTQINFGLPSQVSGQTIEARFRLVDDMDNDGDCNDQAAPGLTGLAYSGEVEDYQWTFPPLNPVAPDAVQISGPASGVTGSDYHFEAAVTPISVTMPLTYTWQAVDQLPVVSSHNFLTDTVTYSWSISGTYPVTVTVENEVGSATSSHLITISDPVVVPPSGLTITGPANGLTNREYGFAAAVTPISTTLPLTYTWLATGQTPRVTSRSSLTDVISFTWSISGTQEISVTVENEVGQVSASRLITISLPLPVMPLSVTINGPVEGGIDRDLRFVASVTPISVTVPLTYSWQAIGQSPVISTSSSLTDSVTFNWDSPGPKLIMVTVENEVGAVAISLEVNIRYQLLLPAIRKK
jgi:hypothetical protein